MASYPPQNRIDNRPAHAPDFPIPLIDKGLFGPNLRSSQRVADIMEQMLVHPKNRNPFLLRCVDFTSEHEEQDPENYWDGVLIFLSELGHNLWNVAFEPCNLDHVVNPIQMYHILRLLLIFLPSVRVLRLIGFLLNDSSLAISRATIICLKRQIKKFPLPQLEYLESLSMVKYGTDYPDPIFNELMRRYSAQLTSLNLFLVLRCWQSHLRHFQQLPNLTQFQIHICVDYDRADLPVWNRLCSSLVAPNLAKLVMWIIPDEECHADWVFEQTLMPLVGTFPSLVYLKLTLTNKVGTSGCLTQPRFVLNGIKTLEIMNQASMHYECLLQYLPDLEYLMVCHELEMGAPPAPLQDFEKWHIFKWFPGSTVYRSGLWTRVPTLKELTLARTGDESYEVHLREEVLDRRTYTRSRHNELMAMTNE